MGSRDINRLKSLAFSTPSGRGQDAGSGVDEGLREGQPGPNGSGARGLTGAARHPTAGAGSRKVGHQGQEAGERLESQKASSHLWPSNRRLRAQSLCILVYFIRISP